jgi:hypothetical protein
MTGSLKRWLHVLHRWSGIVIGLLVLLWFGSGIVMMYVPYPELTEQERMAWLAPLDAQQVAVDTAAAWAATGVAGLPDAVRLNTVAGRPAWHFQRERVHHSVWADSGAPLDVTGDVVNASARAAAPGAHWFAADVIDLDQWTFGRLSAHRPLHRVTADDAAGSMLYVSGRTGELVRDTTRSERAWNWVGSVVHWVYLTPLRKHGGAWRQVVMWTSGAALLLALSGMVLGSQRLRLRRRYAGGRMSPYTGWQAWHHWLGLGVGTLAITWLFSGWLSVGPFGFPSAPGPSAQDRLAFAGGVLAPADLSIDAAAILRRHRGVLELEWRRVDGALYLSALGQAGRALFDGRDGAAVELLPQAALEHALQALRPGAQLELEMLHVADDYYYSHHLQMAFPVLRARFDLPAAPVFYADPRQGQLVGFVDRDTRWDRWLFNGLHRFDFAVLRTRPMWDVVVITLCVLGALLTVSGLVLGWRRLRRMV